MSGGRGTHAVVVRYRFAADGRTYEQLRAALESRVRPAIEMHLRDGVYGHVFEHGHFDTGNKLGYLRANVEYGLKHPELSGEFREYLTELTADWKSGDKKKRA